MGNYPVEILVAELKVKINDAFDGHRTCYRYDACLHKIKELHDRNGEIYYNKALVDEHNAVLKSIIWLGYRDRERYREFSRVQNIIEKYIATGEFSLGVNLPTANIILEDGYLDILFEFEEELRRTLNCTSTIRGVRGIATDFLTFAQTKFSRLNDIAPKIIADFYAYKQKISKHIPHALRKLFNFLHSNGYTEKNLSINVPPLAKQAHKIMPVFTKDEVDEILSSVDRGSVLGKRNYAMIMIAASTGLRECDIRRLKFNDIDWHTHKISIKQHKTNIPIVVPLDIATGNAIADYIINGRPDSVVDEIFLTTLRPYKKANEGAIANAVKKCNKKFCSKGLGSHSFRRYVATSLLSESVPYTRIKEMLGHTQNNDLRSYIRIEHSGLAQCAIDLTGIEPTAEVYEWLKI
jgi:integrase